MVVPTHNRAGRVAGLLAALRRQTMGPERFEVVVVDDGSTDSTSAVLEREREHGELQLSLIERPASGGWAVAREEGWRATHGEIVAFTDDDCVPAIGWLAAGLNACGEHPGAIVQGRTDPIPGELERLPPLTGAFTRTIRVSGPDPAFQTCNVFYPRSLLERVGGFDTEAFAQAPGEDADLAWRAIAAGAPTAFAPDARVLHAVNRLGPLGKLRLAARWDMKAYVRHPELRRAHFERGPFWKGSHYLLVRALIALAVPRRRRLLRVWLGYPYLKLLLDRGHSEGGGALAAPYYALYDLVELAATVRSAVRYRTLML